MQVEVAHAGQADEKSVHEQVNLKTFALFLFSTLQEEVEGRKLNEHMSTKEELAVSCVTTLLCLRFLHTYVIFVIDAE